MTLGQRISLYRKKLNISQEELGARLGVSRQAVSKWETDLSAPDLNNLIGLARELGVSVAELTETPEEPVPDAAYVEKPPTPPSDFPQCRKGRLLWIVLGIFLLLILAVLALSASKPSETITPDPIPANEAEAKVPQSDFALILDWTEDGTFLELGDQEGEYPFGTPLSLDSEETVAKGDNGDTIHTIGDPKTDGIRLTYAHMDGQPDTILKLEAAYTKEISTPRGIHVGSTKAEVVGAYGTDLVYCVKEEGDDLLAKHDYFYAYQPKDAFSNSICFFIKDGLVAGIRVENMLDEGNDAYAVNNISIFPIQRSGDPDYSNRQDIYQEPVDATRQVYIAWNQLVTNENLSAEERYAYRRDVFTNLPDMDWQEFGALGGIDSSGTIFALLDWLSQQEHYSSGDIYFIQRGYAARGIDGAYAEDYCYLLSRALFSDPVAYAKALARSTADDEAVQTLIMGGTAYGADYYPADCKTAVSALDAAINANALTAEETGWAKLLRYYLANPNDGYYADYPKTPAELEN